MSKTQLKHIQQHVDPKSMYPVSVSLAINREVSNMSEGVRKNFVSKAEIVLDATNSKLLFLMSKASSKSNYSIASAVICINFEI